MYERVAAPAGRRWFKLIKIILIVVFFWLVSTSFWSIFHDSQPAPAVPQITVTIPAGASSKQISTLLTDAKVIDKAWLFLTYVRLRGYQNELQSGVYTFNEGTSIRRVVNWLVAGKQNAETKVTLVEGWTAAQYATVLSQALAGANAASWQRDFMNQLQQSYSYDWLASKPTGVDLEGYLFPDTYRFNNSATPTEVIKILLDTFERRVTPEMRTEITRQDKTMHQVVTLASIIEREVQTPKDRRLVADIFWRRLAINMPLQADSTVNYITGKKDPSISAVDRAIDSPYNTYRYPGLPPGSISNPGLDAIQAAITPEVNDAWYFLTTPNGEVIYSRTLAEQTAAKFKYLK